MDLVTKLKGYKSASAPSIKIWVFHEESVNKLVHGALTSLFENEFKYVFGPLD